MKLNKMTDSKSNKINLTLRISSISAGAYHGYCDAQNIPVENDLEQALTYGPAIVRASVEAIKEGLVGFISGAQIGGAIGEITSNTKHIQLLNTGSGGLIGATLYGSICGAFGGIKGGIETIIGYSLGYTVGFLTK